MWDRALELAPDHDLMLRGGELDQLLAAIGDFADLKCPFTVGHSRRVAELSEAAARQVGLTAADVDRVRRAAYVHDLGRMGVPNSVWEKTRALTASDQERIRLYPYLTGRVLSRVRGLEAETAIAEAHRERIDGSGYPRGLRGAALPMTQRVLAAADSYHTSLELRPHREALDAAAAARKLRGEVTAGRLDGAAVEAVLAAAGHRDPHSRRTTAPAGLTPREVEVLGLIARGYDVAQIAERLVISIKTVRNHLEHIYLKAGVTNRTGAALFAIEHGLTGAEDGEPAP